MKHSKNDNENEMQTWTTIKILLKFTIPCIDDYVVFWFELLDLYFILNMQWKTKKKYNKKLKENCNEFEIKEIDKRGQETIEKFLHKYWNVYQWYETHGLFLKCWYFFCFMVGFMPNASFNVIFFVEYKIHTYNNFFFDFFSFTRKKSFLLNVICVFWVVHVHNHKCHFNNNVIKCVNVWNSLHIESI